MIKARDAIEEARRLLGTPYAQMDCIALIRQVIRRAPGGDKAYRCEGTNWLWNSLNSSGKYRHLVWQQEGITGAKAGMLAFKRRGSDVHHVGLVTQEGTVIHASSEYGKTVETPLDASWRLLARHKLIEEGSAPEGAGSGAVRTQGGKLNVRAAPWGKVIGKLQNGSPLLILSEEGDWLRIALDDGREGYVHGDYVVIHGGEKLSPPWEED